MGAILSGKMPRSDRIVGRGEQGLVAMSAHEPERMPLLTIATPKGGNNIHAVLLDPRRENAAPAEPAIPIRE